MKPIYFLSSMLFTMLLMIACTDTNTSQKEPKKTVQLQEDEQKYRPNFHFTPQKNWMNDPNGMFYWNGNYHLYFQHHPFGNVWGPMHWGHAVSKDLVHWEERPIALYPDALGTIFSGSAVVDHNNTSGLGKGDVPPIIAIYTSHDMEAERSGAPYYETQSLAYSLDEGETWEKYAGNPVIKNPAEKDFRDPKVFWMETQQAWRLTLAAGQETRFYGSKDLIHWEPLSEFGKTIGNHNGVWECPDLFQLPIQGTETFKWVHLVSVNPGGPNGGSATQYFVGDFDGETFTVDPEFEKAMAADHRFWLDFGRDNYASVSFSNFKTPSGQQVVLGWMSNWDYATVVPTTTWRSAMTLPRALELVPFEKTYRLQSQPYFPKGNFSKAVVSKNDLKVQGKAQLVSSSEYALDHTALSVVFKNTPRFTTHFQLSNSLGDVLNFGFDPQENQFYIDRTASGKVDFSTKFASHRSYAPRLEADAALEFKLFLDKTSLEIFYDQGATVMSEIFFLNAPFDQLSVEATEGIEIKALEVFGID